MGIRFIVPDQCFNSIIETDVQGGGLQLFNLTNRVITIDRMKHALRKPLPGPRARRLIHIIKKISYDSTFTYPLVVANVDGCRIKDVDGNVFLDFSSNIGTPIVILASRNCANIERVFCRRDAQDRRAGFLL